MEDISKQTPWNNIVLFSIKMYVMGWGTSNEYPSYTVVSRYLDLAYLE